MKFRRIAELDERTRRLIDNTLAKEKGHPRQSFLSEEDKARVRSIKRNSTIEIDGRMFRVKVDGDKRWVSPVDGYTPCGWF